MTEAKIERELALRLDGVSKVFPGVRALDSVDLAVRAGEVHGIVGENGAGKSTLMAVASGALVPETGSVHIGGKVHRGGSPAEAQALGMAIVYQEPALLPDLTVAENLYFQLLQERRPPIQALRSWARARLADWSADVDIDPDARVEELRAEQRFIVDIVRALAQEPVALVLDEPTEHLAGEDVERLFRAVRDRVAAGGTVIYISHRIREVKEIADRISVLRDGRQRGTYDSATVTERHIVNLIVGRELEAEFPAKPGVRQGSGPAVFAVENASGCRFSGLSMSVMPGEIVGFAGIEGNGQRDAVRSFAGLTRWSGRMTVDGQAVGHRSSKIAFLSGDRHREGVFPSLTVRGTVGLRNLDQVSTAGFVRPRRERAFAQRAVTELAVKTPGIEAPVESLSGGNQQKTLLASVMHRNPRVLIVDEPTRGSTSAASRRSTSCCAARRASAASPSSWSRPTGASWPASATASWSSPAAMSSASSAARTSRRPASPRRC
jgi:ribose transport system ATP-binding protein